jgi:phosphatidylserine/phosphatidylglycerophosphate/cardiolipin synthase-like enzyme
LPLAEAIAVLVALEGPVRVEIFADALAAGKLGVSSPSAVLQTHLGVPQVRLRSYRDVLLAAAGTTCLVPALRAAARTAAKLSAAQPLIEVAWTYPGPARPGFRTTGGVARELIAGSRETLLVVGYTVTVNPNLAGLASETLRAIADAARRGVAVTVVLHRDASRRALLSSWSRGTPVPAIFTWPKMDDEKASVHAKLIVSDRRDVLITSANLTYHDFERNIEMGVRVTGSVAAEVQERIQDLIAARELVPWED